MMLASVIPSVVLMASAQNTQESFAGMGTTAASTKCAVVMGAALMTALPLAPEEVALATTRTF